MAGSARVGSVPRLLLAPVPLGRGRREKARHEHAVLRANAALAAALLLVGCVPFPHYGVALPEIMGTVHRNGKPVPNALVYMEHPTGEQCSFQSPDSTRTDGDGRFRLDVRKEFRFFVVMDSWSNWAVCIADGERRYQGWHERVLGGPPPKVELDCDLESAPRVRQIGNTMGKTMGVCRSSEWKDD
jgi:hypothetical protein